LEKHSDYAAAERIYLKALELAPGNPETLKRLGIVEQTEMRFEESITHFKQALSRDAQYLEVNFFLGVSYLGQNDFANAIQSFQQELSTAKPTVGADTTWDWLSNPPAGRRKPSQRSTERSPKLPTMPTASTSLPASTRMPRST
jgi:tetratricopeptide (TPR) repeat protein